MFRELRRFFPGLLLLSLLCSIAVAQEFELKNADVVARFGPQGLISVTDLSSASRIELTADEWSISFNQRVLRSGDGAPTVRKSSEGEIIYAYERSPYRVETIYSLEAGRHFISKQLRVKAAPGETFTVTRVIPWEVKVRTPVASDFIPSVYVPQFGSTLEQSRKMLPGKDFGEFLRFAEGQGAFLTVQNPFLEVHRDLQSISISYAPEMEWQTSWGDFASDIASMGAYRLSGVRNPREMTKEWHLAPADTADDGMDKSEVEAFTSCVRSFLIHPAPDPISVLVGWTLNDYQIDVGTAEGRDEYKRIIDTAADLGIQTLLYAPGNSKTATRIDSVDSWGWEYVLWLGMGQQIRKNAWDPAKDPIPASLSEMLEHSRQKHVGLLAYVYPSIPFEKDPSWIVQGGLGHDGESPGDSHLRYATLASRSFQDYLIHNLIAFKKRTGIAGYSFDYAFLNEHGSSSYAQWYGWRRVIETLRREFPEVVIDGRQSYQLYGPWSWLAGNYPHPTGTDEQPESFKPYPDLHFDRVSADRARFVNYWYRNYQFAPEEVIPGYATHQTERSRSRTAEDGGPGKAEMMYTRFKPRDWDYLGYRYSFLSSIATGGWNNVVDMIPARDPEEWRHFSAADKAWIRQWLSWTVENKEYLRHTRTILDQPAMGHVDGTASIVGDHGFLFLFNPNYKQLSAEVRLDEGIGLASGQRFILKELYPFAGRVLGKQGSGLWSRGDGVHLDLAGTSATVLEIVPVTDGESSLVFNAGSVSGDVHPRADINESVVNLSHVAGQPGTTQAVGVVAHPGTRISHVSVNGHSTPFTQTGDYIEAQVHFAGGCFGQAQQIALTHTSAGELAGSFLVPQRILSQLEDRRRAWPIPWTQEDYESTWLVPERLLLFAQVADGTDTAEVSAAVDDKPLAFKPAYSAGRPEPATFVGFYADVSKIAPGVPHTLKLHLSGIDPAQLQGVFFDNVEPELTESITP